jgi:hypothetical protein
MRLFSKNCEVKKITLSDLAKTWKFTPSVRFVKRFEKTNLEFRALNMEEFRSSVQKTIQTLDTDIEKAGQHRISKWENGWSQNLQEFNTSYNQNSLVPKYFGKIPIIRWKQEWIHPLNNSMEYHLFGLMLDWIYEEFFPGSENLYEFGCGTGHNLVRARELFPNLKLTGLDWTKSSQETISLIAKNTKDNNLSAFEFDYFIPNPKFIIEKNSIVLTVASLEQTGEEFEKFIDFLVDAKPKLVIHIEPIEELLDPNDLLDLLSIKYFRKRNYLKGLLGYLRLLESRNIISIHSSKRTFVGSFFIEGYSLVVWKPV